MSDEKEIKQDNRFDDLCRQSLGTLKVEPSARVWNRMSRQLLWKELLKLNFSNLPGYTWVIVAAIAVITGTGIYWLASGDEADLSPQPVVTEQAAGIRAGENSVQQPEQPTPVSTSATVPGKVHAPVQQESVSLSPEPETGDDMASSMHPVALSLSEIQLITAMTPVPFDLFAIPSAIPGELLPVPNPKPLTRSLEETPTPGKKLPQSLDLGINITPDIVFYQNNSDYFKYDYTLDAGVLYQFGRFYLQSGLGISWSTDIGSYAISANKNDSIGYYYSVVSFTEDPGNPGKLEYTTSVNTVFDTNQYVYDYSTRNSYTYLQIPLVIGYRALVRPLWSLSVDAGGFWSALIASDEPDPVFYIPEGRITNVENTTPVRRTNSFGLLGSVRFDYRFAKQFSLMISPVFKYHLNAIDDQDFPGATQPWSVGLRVGIWYRIDLNK